MKFLNMPIIRWIGVLPCGIFGFFLGYYLFKLLYLPAIALGNYYWLDILFISVLAFGFGGFLFVLIGSTVAPKYIKETALFLLLISVFIAGASSFSSLLSEQYTNFWKIGSQIVGSIIAYSYVRSEYQS